MAPVIIWIWTQCGTSRRHQTPSSRCKYAAPPDGKDKPDLNGALQLLTILPANKTKEAEGIDKMHHIKNDALNATAPAFRDLSKNATTPFIEPRRARFLAKQSKVPICRILVSTVGTPCYDYSKNRNGFKVGAARIDGALEKVGLRSLQLHLLQAYH